MHASRYTVGQDHTGSWWVIAPGGTTGYEFGPDHHDAEQATITCEWANERGAEPGVDSADPPPELVGGVGDTALAGDLTLRNWDYPREGGPSPRGDANPHPNPIDRR